MLRRLFSEHGQRALRYCAVSVVNVAVGGSALAVGHAVFGWHALAANLFSWIVSTSPAYLLSRAWVWNRSGAHRLGGEVIPFWIMALMGLVLSSCAVALAGHFTDRTVFVLAGNVSAYATIWVARYLFLDQVLWRRDPV